MITRQFLLIWWLVSTIMWFIFWWWADESIPMGLVHLIMYTVFIPGMLTTLVGLIVWAGLYRIGGK